MLLGEPLVATGSMSASPAIGMGVSSNEVPWVVTAEEKAKYDVMFTAADADRDGWVEWSYNITS